MAAQPTTRSTNLRNELKSNASSIPTSRGGGGHGYLGLILSADDYNNAVGQPFDPPAAHRFSRTILPVPQPPKSQKPTASTPKTFANGENTTTFKPPFANNSSTPSKMSTFPPSRDPLTGYNNLSVHDILKHLFTSYGKIPPRAHPKMLRIYTNLGMPTRLLNT
jgi:hypothetical protein